MKDLITGLIELLKIPYGMGFIIVLALILGPAISYGFAFKYFADTQAAALKQLHDDIIQIVRCASDGKLNAEVPNHR
jgi:hypothetical protein